MLKPSFYDVRNDYDRIRHYLRWFERYWALGIVLEIKGKDFAARCARKRAHYFAKCVDHTWYKIKMIRVPNPRANEYGQPRYKGVKKYIKGGK